MNYRHLYHAGNFADVFKHIILTLLIVNLKNKDKAFCYLDTHAGIGFYDLSLTEAQKTHEYESGILKLLQQKNFPTEFTDYLKIINLVNKNSKNDLQFYPGSPLIVKYLLRPQDRMILCELHPEDVQLLKQEFMQDKQAAVHHMDGYQALKAFLPPAEKRGLVFIDPPFEQPNEFDTLKTWLDFVYQRWPTGIYAVWYPRKDIPQVKKFLQSLQNSQWSKILVIELNIYPEDSPQGLNGCGMVIINPPWKLDEELKKIMPWLLKVLAGSENGNFRVDWLREES